MQPRTDLITINDNKKKIEQMLMDLVFLPRLKAIEWSKITRQTPNLKIGYPGQHLASLITGIKGEGTGARGNDLRDGSEVKSCSRIDPLDKCKECGASVSRIELVCGACNSDNILRSNDSKWLFGVRDENELKTLIQDVKRIVLILADYSRFEEKDYSEITIQAYEIWPSSRRHRRFKEIMTNYYNKIYLEHKKLNPNKTPAPKNFWPYSYQFYLSNPIPIFRALIKNADTKPMVKIEYYVEPSKDRTNLTSTGMPIEVLGKAELDLLFNIPPRVFKKKIKKAEFPGFMSAMKARDYQKIKDYIPVVDEDMRAFLPLRDTDKISVAKTTYSRRAVQQ